MIFEHSPGEDTYTMLDGSFLPSTWQPRSNFSFFLVPTWVVTYLWPACDLRTPHQGASVSIMMRSIGIDFTVSIFCCVFSELKLKMSFLYPKKNETDVQYDTCHPFNPMYHPSLQISSASSEDPSNECTTPAPNSSSCLARISQRSFAAARQCRNKGSCVCIASSSCFSKYLERQSEIAKGWEQRRLRLRPLKGPSNSSQIWTYIVKFDKKSSLRPIWGQMMLPFINYGKKCETDRGSFTREFSTPGTQEIMPMIYGEDPVWSPL